MLKIDMHAHILPCGWPDMNEQFGVTGFPVLSHDDGRYRIMRDGKFFREIWSNCWDVEQRIAEYAEHGIDVQVISTVPVMFSYDQPVEPAAALTRFLNDHLAEAQRDHPRHIISLGSIPMQDVDAAVAELERLKELGIPGVQIGSNVNQRNLNDPGLFPIFEAAQDLDMSILVHPWGMMGKDVMPDYWLPWLVGMPAELSRCICSLIFGGVMERLPRLRFCFAHGGGSFPYTIGRIEHGWRMRPDLVAHDNPVNPRDYLGRFWVDSVTHDDQALRYLLDVVGDDAVMLGTDYPFPLGEQKPGNLIHHLNLPEGTERRLFHRNCLKWLGLDEADYQ
ncbi:MAG: amidohydrolase family protein [Xanthomonadales bacterium]|nr:amidohydrolase family protein [Xanthomonadales bacterium]